MEFIPLVALPFLINKILDWARSIIPDRIEAKFMIPISLMLGVIGTFAFARSDWGTEMMVGDKSFGSINSVSLVIVGLVIGSTAGIVSDFKPNRLTPAQMDSAVKNADTVIVQGAEPDAPVTNTEIKKKPRKKVSKKV